MGCGCKGNKNQTSDSESVKVSTTNESSEQLKDKIKKTVEKYYTTNKKN